VPRNTLVESANLVLFAEAKSAALVETLTLSNLQEFYAAYIDPRSKQRAKLSIHLHAQAKPASKTPAGAASIKFSVEASNLFLVDLKAAQIPVDEPQYIALSKAEPPLDAVLQFWGTHLGNVPFISTEKKEQLLERAKELAKLHPVGIQGTEDLANKGQLLEGTIVVDDLKAFKKTVPVSNMAVPVMALEVEEVPSDNVGPRL
jgi:insulysin